MDSFWICEWFLGGFEVIWWSKWLLIEVDLSIGGRGCCFRDFDWKRHFKK